MVPCGQVLAVGPVTEHWKNWRESVGCAMYSSSAPGFEHQTSNPSAYLQRGTWHSSPAVTAAAMRAARRRGRTLCTAMVRSLCYLLRRNGSRLICMKLCQHSFLHFFSADISSNKNIRGLHSHYKCCAHDNVDISS